MGVQGPAEFHLGDGVTRAAAFTNRPPSPPYIHVPTALGDATESALTITPSYDSVDPSLLTVEDINIITGNRDQRAAPLINQIWRYEDRRKAQLILDFLYLGPLTVVRDRAWLQKEGITMLLAARDASMAQARVMSLEKTAAELGIEAAYVDVAGRQELIRSFPAAVAKINDHLVRVYKSQARQITAGASGEPVTAIDPSTFRRGKVLVFCETGNERSAAIVAAYVMTMYGKDAVGAIQFIVAQRFCANFDEEAKHLLRSYGDILVAKRMTARAHRPCAAEQQPAGMHENATLNPAAAVNQSCKKRGIEDTMMEDEQGEFSLDMGRYEDRAPFQPFVQRQMN